MYGLLVENLASFVRIQWGESKWDMVRKNAGIDAPSFSIHHVYPETLLNKLARSAFQVLGVDDKSFFEAMGIYFVEFVGQYGYDAMLTVLGRHMRDFLNNLDNLHEYLKFSYTKMRAPSFYCDEESATGLRLHYRSRRRGFVYYVMGQIKQVARHFYDQDCEIEIISETLDGDTMHTIFQLTFDNDAFSEAESLKSMIRKEQQLPIRASIIFELFPFCIVFNQEMVIKFTGHALLTILKDLVGQVMTEAFEIVKPLITFCFPMILERRNNIFELITLAPIKDDEALTGSLENDSDEETGTSLRLRGQMMHMEEWEMMLFLANPVLPDIDSLVQSGLFINDLSLHDCSRDLVLAGTQQSVELKLALDQEQQKSKKLEDSMKKLDEEMKRTDELLYQMIPHKVADRIRKGENPVDTCETFDCVSILFSDVVTFTDICSRITPMQVVTMLNHMYSLFDQLTERNGVYKVETIGDSYMVVSGAPDPMPQHAERIVDMALDMCDAMQAVGDPSRDGEPLKIRVGCHSGTVVAGVVGVKMPRYCLFGDAVNTASRMESSSEGGRIQISEACKNLLPTPYQTERRGTVTVKGKGEMDTYWLLGREARVPLNKVSSKSFNWDAPKSTITEAPKAQASNLTKQMSVASTAASESASGIVKDEKMPAAAETKNLKRQQTFLKSSLGNEPVEMSGAAVKANNNIVKPEVKPSNPPPIVTTQKSSVDSDTSSKAPPLDKPPPSPKRKLSREVTPFKPASPLKNLVRSVSPTPDLVPWLKSTAEQMQSPKKIAAAIASKNNAAPPSQAKQIVDLPPVNIRRSSTSTPTMENSDNQPSEQPSIQTQSQQVTISLPNGSEEIVEVTINNLIPNNGEDGQAKNPFIDGINGIRKGSRDFRNKIKDKKLSTVTVEAITDMGCTEFAAKQKEIISQACVLL